MSKELRDRFGREQGCRGRDHAYRAWSAHSKTDGLPSIRSRASVGYLTALSMSTTALKRFEEDDYGSRYERPAGRIRVRCTGSDSVAGGICLLSQANAAAGGLLLNAVPPSGNGVQQQQQLAHHRYQRHLPSLPPAPANRGNSVPSPRCGVSPTTPTGTARDALHHGRPPDRAIPALPATVPGPRRQTHQCGQCLPFTFTQLRQIGHQRGRRQLPPLQERSGTASLSPTDGHFSRNALRYSSSIRAISSPSHSMCRSVDLRAPSTQALLQAIALLHPAGPPAPCDASAVPLTPDHLRHRAADWPVGTPLHSARALARPARSVFAS